LIDFQDPEGFEAEPRNADVLRFDGTVVAIFKKLVLGFKNPEIGLTVGEMYTMSVRAESLSVNGTVKTIKGVRGLRSSRRRR
jgi:hypothetical protein